MKLVNNKKGLTLIEVILSLAILGILAITFLTIFSSGYKAVVRAGNKSVAAYDSQLIMTNKLTTVEDLVPAEFTEDTISLKFSGGPTIPINVKIFESSVDFRGSKSIMTSFIRNP